MYLNEILCPIERIFTLFDSYIGQRGENEMYKEQILILFCGKIRHALKKSNTDFKNIQEIRIRVNQPIIFFENQKELFLTEDGEFTEQSESGMCADLHMLKEVLECACGYSGYAFEEEISRGYLTIPGGHRIGLAGRTVLNDGKVQTLKYISALNIRIAHPVTGCGEKWKKYLYIDHKPCHVLIISPPGCGKTTLLRDVIRLYANGDEENPGITVGVADERSEIAGTYRGMRTHDLGIRTDVLDACPKSIGMEMLLRSMAPKVLAVDEIGVSDVYAIENALRCGCKVLATLHGEKMQDYMDKPGYASLVKEQVFERYIFLRQGLQPGKVDAIYGQNFEMIWGSEECI